MLARGILGSGQTRVSPFDLSRTLPVGGGLLVPFSLSGSPVIKQLMQMVTMVPGQGGRFQSVCFPEQLYLLWQHLAMVLRKLGSRKGLASLMSLILTQSWMSLDPLHQLICAGLVSGNHPGLLYLGSTVQPQGQSLPSLGPPSLDPSSLITHNSSEKVHQK